MTVGTIVSLKGKAQRLRLGEKLGDWKLESVGINEAVFSSGSQQQTLVLKPCSYAHYLILVKRSERELCLTLQKLSQ